MTRILFRLSKILFIALGCGLLALEGSAMSLFKREEVCLFSGFKGKITFEGEPLSNVKVIRHIRWEDEKGQYDEAITNEQGEFEFSSVWGSLKNILPTQFVSNQRMFVEHDGESKQIWGGGKLTKGEFDEFGGTQRTISCELTDDPVRVELPVGFVFTNCKWNND